MSATMTVELALAVRADVGECPVWDEATQTLLWVDITGGTLHRFDPATGTDSVEFDAGRDLGAAVPRQGGGFALAVREGFALAERDGVPAAVAAVLEADHGLRMNDGACDPAGRFWAGSMAYDEGVGRGSLFRLDVDGGATEVLGGLTVPNGLDWSADGRTMYFVDSAAAGIDAFAFDVETGTIAARRRVVDIPGPGVPDGLAVDADGCLWVAMWGGGRVVRYTAAGRVDRIVELPVAQASSCAFGGPDYRDLYVTTAAHRLTAEELEAQPHAGALFHVDTDAHGRPPTLFAG